MNAVQIQKILFEIHSERKNSFKSGEIRTNLYRSLFQS